jgi:hypothetical protein
LTANGAALCIGVSRYNDRGLAPLPDAALTAREIQKALDTRVFPASTAIVDPGSNGDLFLKLQKAAGEARGGTFVLYFAGHALRRGGDLLLTTRDTELEGTKGCVPWSDVRGMLKREGIVTGVFLLNVDQPAGSGRPQLDGSSVAVMGSLRNYDASGGNASLRAYADAVLAVLQRPGADLEAYLTDGVLDATGLNKYLTEKAPAAAAHASFAKSAKAAVLRDFATPSPMSMRGSQLPPTASLKPSIAGAPPVASVAPKPAVVEPPKPTEAAPPPPAPEPPAPEPPKAPEPPVEAKAEVAAPTPEPVAAAPEPATATATEPATATATEPATATATATEPATATATEPATATATEPVAVSAPQPAPVSSPPPNPAPLAARPAQPLAAAAPSRLPYVLLAAAAVVAAILYALLRT